MNVTLEFTNGEGIYDYNKLTMYFVTLRNMLDDTISTDERICIPFPKEDFEKMFYQCEIEFFGHNKELHDFLDCVMENKKEYFGVDYGIAHSYMDCYDGEKNVEKAIEFYEKAIDNGNDKAMFELGKMYGTNGNDDEMVKLYEMAIEKNNINATTSLIEFYMKGEDKNIKKDKIIELYEKLVKLEHVDSMINYSKLLYNGDFIIGDKDKAKQILTFLATQKDNGDAMYLMGKIVSIESNTYFGILVPDADLNDLESIHWYEKAAEKKNINGMCVIASMYQRRGNNEETIKILNELIDMEYVKSYGMFGRFYYYIENYNMAIEMYNNGISKNDFSCLIDLAISYLNGTGVEKNIDKAIELFELAISKNNFDALTWLYYIYTTDRIDFDKAIQILNFGVDKNEANEMLGLASLYETGTIVPKDTDKAQILRDNANKIIEAGMNSDKMI